MYSQFIQDPILRRLNESYLKLCSSGDNGKATLILNNSCFQVIDQSKTLAQFCALQGLAYPVDNASTVSIEILPGETLQLFNNGTNSYISLPLPADKTFVRAVLIFVQYPTTDNNGDDIDPTTKVCNLILTNQAMSSFTISLGDFFSHFSNPITVDSTQILNELSINNPSTTFPICVQALLVNTKSADTKISCNC